MTVPKKVAKKPAKEQDIYDAVAEHRIKNGLDPVTCKPATAKKKPKIATEMDKALEAAMAEINKDYGDGSVTHMDDGYKVKVDVIPTGNLAIDHALGVGGVPRGRIVEIFGQESAGKSTFCLSVIAQAQRMELRCAFIDVENAFDPDYAKKLGVSVGGSNWVFSQPDSGVEALRVAEKLIKSNAIGVVVVDSVAALVSEQELNGEIGDAAVGAQARLMSSSLRKLSSVIRSSNTCCIFTNQLREKIGIMYGNPNVTPGGKALKFYASIRIDIARIGPLKNGEEIIGNRTRVKIVKNKVAAPYKEAELDLIYGEGIAGAGSVVDLAIQFDVLQKRGSWISYKGINFAKGRDAAKGVLKSDAILRHEIEIKVKLAMSNPTQPVEEDEDQIP